MKKILTLLVLGFFMMGMAQTTANRFFYELTYKPKKDSARTEKVMTVLDIIDGKSIFRDYTMIAQDSLLKAKIDAMQKSGVYKDLSNDVKMPKFSYKVAKSYPGMEVTYSENIANGMTPVQLAYKDNTKFNWKISGEKAKIGDYNAQKATTEFGGRTWTAWFADNIPFQDGPYKFHGLPGLIVKIEDSNKNYSWELKGNKKIANFEEVTMMEKMSPGGAGSLVEVPRDKFEKTFNDYKKDPFASFRSQMTPDVLARKMPGQDRTVGEMLKEHEKNIKKFYNSSDNPIEITR